MQEAPGDGAVEEAHRNLPVAQQAPEPEPEPRRTEQDTVLAAGMQVEAERKGSFEAAEVVGQSKKKEGQWVLRFASDGKCIAKTPEQIRQF